MLPSISTLLVLGITAVTEAVNERVGDHSDAYAPVASTPPCDLPASATTALSVCPEGPDIPNLTPTGQPPTLSPLPPWPVPSSPPTSTVFGNGNGWETTPPTGDYIPGTNAPAEPCTSIVDFTTLVISVTSTTTVTPCPDGDAAPACSDNESEISTGPSFVPYPLTSSAGPQQSTGVSSVSLPYEVIPSGDMDSSAVSSPGETAEEPTATSEDSGTATGRGSHRDASLMTVLLVVLFSAGLIETGP